MANKTIEMYKIRQIIRLMQQGKGSKYISASVGLSRNTVKKYMALLRQQQQDLATLEQMDNKSLLSVLHTEQRLHMIPSERYEQLKPLLADYVRQLSRRGVTRGKIYAQYIASHPDGYKISRFRDYLNAYMGRVKPSLRVIHIAGDKMYVDFTGQKLYVVDKATSQIHAVEVFVAILGCSQLTYVQAVATQKKEDFISACESALHYFGGVPQAIVPDNLKSAVTKAGRYESKVNPHFAAFAEHYHTHVFPTRVYRPKDKALVEGAVKLIYTSIFTHIDQQVFYDLDALNTAIRIHLEAHNDRPMSSGAPSRREQFNALEKEMLRPLNKYKYDPLNSRSATVAKNGFVTLDYHYYSVPYEAIGKKVKLLYNTTHIDIYQGETMIAHHQRSYAREKFIQDPVHVAGWQKHQALSTPEELLDKAQALSTAIYQYVRQMLERNEYPEKNLRAVQGILRMERKVGVDRLSNACKRADEFGIYSYQIIASILQTRADYIEEDKEQSFDQLTMPSHDNIRGRDYYS